MKIAKISILVMILFLIVSCSAAKTEVTVNKPENVNVQNSSNVNGPPQNSAAETQINQTSPDALVKDLYKVHDQDMKSENDRILSGKNRTYLDKYFDTTLADLIWKDLTTHKDEVGVLDFDPFYNAQDFDVKNLVVGQPKIENGKATVVVTFENSGRKDTLSYSLVQQNSAWKISDIKYTDGSSLIGYFKEDAKNNASGDSGNFEGTYQVGDTTATVKPIKMAFEIKWSKGNGTMIFFSSGEEGKYEFKSEDKGNGVDTFIFNDAKLTIGKFVRADGKEMSVKKIK